MTKGVEDGTELRPKPTGVMCCCCGHETFKNGRILLCDYCFLGRLKDPAHQCSKQLKPEGVEDGMGDELSEIYGILNTVLLVPEISLGIAYIEPECAKRLSAWMKRNEPAVNTEPNHRKSFGKPVESPEQPSMSTRDAAALHETIATLRAELARERERHRELRKAMTAYRTAPYLHIVGTRMCMNDEFGDTRCPICIKADALLEPAPVATGEGLS